MTIPRSQLVDLAVTRYYHCISRCVRRAFLCGEGYEHRKDWIEKRLEELSSIFAVSVCGYSAMDNHAHVVVRLEGCAMVDQWSDHEVAVRWGRLYPQRDKDRKPLPLTKAWINEKLQDAAWIARTRKRLASLGWFMECFKDTTPSRIGMISGFSLAQYLQLVDWTSRLARAGKARVNAEVESLL